MQQINNFIDKITNVLLPYVEKINGYLSDYILLFLLVGVGLFYTIRTNFVQLRCLGEGFKRVFGGLSFKKKNDGEGGLSSFQALATAIAAQVGTGNIIGACFAILVGGPGAIFWMWIIAFLGMATIYAEAILAQKTKVIDAEGHVQGGPVYYIKTAFKGKFGKFLAGFFAMATILSLGFMGTMVQSRAISSAVSAAIPPISNYPWIIGLILAVLCGIIFLGGVQRIASVAEKIVPVMAGLYLILGIVVLCINFRKLPETFGLIFKYAFNAKAIIGGTGASFISCLMLAMRNGAKRGLFSNEAGMGSTPHAHAQAKVDKPHDQGVVAMVGVFIDTFVVLTITALVIISTFYTSGGALSTAQAVQNTVLSEENMLQNALGSVFGSLTAGNIIVAVCLTFFAFTTIIGWNFFAKINFTYLFGKKLSPVFSVIAILAVLVGSFFPMDLITGLFDTVNSMMVFPNVLALLALSALVVTECKRKKSKKDQL